MPHRSKILIVDDDPLNVKLLAAKLPAKEYDILKAYDGTQALAMVESEPPDLILLDIMMPGIDGYEVTRKLKNNPQTRDIPVVLVTALDSTDDKVKGLEVGADEFLNKPVNSAELTTRVKSFLRLRRYQEQLKSRSKTDSLFATPEEAQSCLQASNGPASILLVEDNDRDVRLLQGYLENDKYQVSLSRDGEETLSRVAGERFDVILLDILLPGMDGFEVCRQLKEKVHTRDIQIVVITCLQDLESKLRGLELGVDDFLVKPINPTELKARLKALLKKKRYLDRLHVNYETALHYAITDRRTGLFNHGYFEHSLDTEIKRAVRQGHPLSLLMIDIDDFKNYNDTLGHLAGDAILKEIGQLIGGNTREVDTAARYGGEEFAVLLPYTPPSGAVVSAERLRRRIEDHELAPDISLSSAQLTVSIGIAGFPDDAATAVDLVKLADAALYQAKRSGKNKVCCYGESAQRKRIKKA